MLGRYLAVLAPDLEDPQFSTRLFMGGMQGFIFSQKIIQDSTLLTHEMEKIAHQATKQLLTGTSRGASR